MRKSMIFLILLFEILCLSSCMNIHLHRRNYFVEGEFSGFNTHNTEEVFYLTVSEISISEYEISQGINVVNDIFKKKYYSLEVYYIVGQSDEKNYLTFSNLKDYGSPICYRGDNGYILQPFCTDEGSSEPFDIERDTVYKMEIPSKDKSNLTAFVYFYKRGRD